MHVCVRVLNCFLASQTQTHTHVINRPGSLTRAQDPEEDATARGAGGSDRESGIMFKS